MPSEKKSDKPEKKSDQPEKFLPPAVNIGEVVGWRRDVVLGKNFRRAVVKSVNEETLDLDIEGLGPYRGVRYETDPVLARSPHARENYGMWFILPDTKRMAELEETVESLVGTVGTLVSAVATLQRQVESIQGK